MMFVAAWFARKVGGMKRVLILGTSMNIIMRVISFFIGYEGWRILIVIVLMALAGIPNNLNGIATTTIWGDSVDYMEWKTGHRNEGSVFALQNLVAKIGTAISTFTTALSLHIMNFDATRYDQDLPQDDLFYTLAWPLFILTPALGSVFYLIPILMMKYSEKQKLEVERELKLRRAMNAEAAATEYEANILDLDIY